MIIRMVGVTIRDRIGLQNTVLRERTNVTESIMRDTEKKIVLVWTPIHNRD